MAEAQRQQELQRDLEYGVEEDRVVATLEAPREVTIRPPKVVAVRALEALEELAMSLPGEAEMHALEGENELSLKQMLL